MLNNLRAGCKWPEGGHGLSCTYEKDYIWDRDCEVLVQESSRSSAAQSFVVELLQIMTSTSQPDLVELRALLMKTFLAGLGEGQSLGK